MMKFKKFLTAMLIIFAGAAGVGAPIDITYENGIYHIILSGEKIKKRIKFVAAESLMTNKEIHTSSDAKLTINAGYFDPENEKTMSYIVSDRQTVADPLFNENLHANPVLRKNIDKILDRTEFRVVECNNKFHYEIVPHKSNVDFGCNIITSAQGGPMIFPELRLEDEFFIVKEDDKVVRESASVLHKTSRTIIGIKDGDAHILIITDENPMDLYEVQAFVKKLKFDRAMAFDGGSSTSMNYLDKYSITSAVGDGGGRLLKSFMLVF